jgi:hypothetical protein
MNQTFDSVPLATPTCPLCHILDESITAIALETGASWRCRRCGHLWSATRLATVARYDEYMTAANSRSSAIVTADRQRSLVYQ